MISDVELLSYARKAVQALLDQGKFENGFTFRRTQREAFEAYRVFLAQDLPVADLLTGFFEIPTGIGKTAVFAAIIDKMHEIAREEGQKFKSVIVTPTINLMDQTKEALEKYAPLMRGQIGFFGDGHRDLKKPSTIMSYDAWVSLTEGGHLNSSNTNILISDEAHRGTSERRLENIFRKFSSSSIRIAFTATAHFDEMKSVQHTHKNEIFYKSLPEAVRQGELSSYIQIQPRVIRLPPLQKGESETVSVVADGETRRLDRRWVAWNKRVVSITRTGIDRVTHDPLSDNRSGYFTRNTTQADVLAAWLNADPVLSKKAHNMGYEAAAISIHSKLPDPEQKRRYKALKRGLYKDLVGDDMFKEGFDLDELKNIFDTPHGSLVEKAQIIGRGTRSWFNERKNRYEGLTVVDTIVYIGSDDREEDARLRRNALAKAITAVGILEGAYVVSPDYEPPPIAPDPQEEPIPIGVKKIVVLPPIVIQPSVEPRQAPDAIINVKPDAALPEEQPEEMPEVTVVNGEPDLVLPDGAAPSRPKSEEIEGHTVEEYTTEEETRTFFAEIEKIKEERSRDDYVEITKALHSKFLKERKRTGIGPYLLLKGANDVPEGLNESVIASWFKQDVKTARQPYIDYALQRWASFPSVKPTESIEIADEMHQRFVQHKERIGIGVIALFEGAKDKPDGLTPARAEAIFRRAQKSARRDWIDWLETRCESFPDLEYVDLTPAIVETVRAHNKRTGVAGDTLIKKGKNVPDGFSSSVLSNLLAGKIKKFIRKDFLDFILTTYEGLPDKKQVEYVDKTDFSAEKKRTGFTAVALFNRAAQKPEGMTVSIAKTIDGKRSRKVRQDHQDWIAEEYRKLPTVKPVAYVTLTAQARAKFEKYKDQTGITGKGLIDGATDVPAGITSNAIHNIFHNPEQKTIRDDLLEWMEKRYEALIKEM